MSWYLLMWTRLASRDFPVSASPTLGLKVCATMPSWKCSFLTFPISCFSLRVPSGLVLAGTLPSCTQCAFVLSFCPAYSMWPPYPSKWVPASLHTSLPSLPSLYMEVCLECHFCYRITMLSVYDTILQMFLKIKSWLSLHLWHISHLEITLKYHIRMCKEKANVTLMNSEFIQLLNHRMRVLGWTFC